MFNWKHALVGITTLALGACATVPQPLTGTYTPVTPQTARSGSANGTHVRWGGQIIKTEPQEGQTCFYVLGHPLDNVARPQTQDSSTGRFVACHSGFYDPEVFVRGREVTFTGTLHGVVSHKVGKYDYPYPRVQADTVYLWPKRPRYPNHYRDPYANPAWGPSPFWGPGYWSPYYDPFWYQPRVIVVPRRGHGGHHHHGKGK